MSNLFRVHRSTFVVHAGPAIRRDRTDPPASKSVLLRDDHIILLAIDGLLALYASIKRRWDRRRTLRALAHLDDRELRDVGLAREWRGYHKSYRVLAELNETELSNLSERGLQVRRELRRSSHGSGRKQ